MIPPFRTHTAHPPFPMILRLLPVLSALALLVAGCGGDGGTTRPATAADTASNPDQITLSVAQLQEVAVQTTEVTKKPVTTTLQLPARIQPDADQEAFVTSLVNGRVEKLRVGIGARVEKGQVLADVAAPDLSQMVADLRQARDELDRQRRLEERGVAIEKNLRAAERQWQAARQRLRSIGVRPNRIERVATGARDMGTLPLEAPIDGVVLDRMSVLGAPVQQGDELFHIADLQPIRVVADVFERNLDQVEEGQRVLVTTPMSPSRTYRSSVAQLTAQVEDESRAARARVVLDNGDASLRPGMYASVTVERTGDPTAALPARALLTDSAGAYVLIRTGDRTFRRIYVDAAAEEEGDVAVPSLSPGTDVVTKGAYQIVSALNQSR